MTAYKFTNALAAETSPYLLQHAHNPVDWHPWSSDALEMARRLDRPILLSIGYSACHWCHVMERESFENEDIAALMNRLFINIKVDREERPDLDAIYMRAVQMIAGRGGWPMTVFLTPDQVPFYGGSYFPPEDRHGMPGFPRVLRSVAEAYGERRGELQGTADAIVRQLREGSLFREATGGPDPDFLDIAAENLLADHDPQNGGFGGAPKFPQAMALDFLLRSYARTGKGAYRDAVELTLHRMAGGGIYDQLGGGFHRYSVDARWQVPHFEKMLYDNALLSRVYLDAYLLTGEPLYRRITEETLDYLLRDMSAPEGGFYAAEDADSEGEEGRYYTWERAEVAALVPEEDLELFCRYFGIMASGDLEGRNALHVPRAASLVAKLNNVQQDYLEPLIERGKRSLLAARGRRPRPARDTKVLADWNGLVLRSLAEAARGLDRQDYLSAANRLAGFLLSVMQAGGRLQHAYGGGRAHIEGFLDDYACLIDGLVSLYEATFDPHWLREAGRLGTSLLIRFRDREAPGFFLTSGDHEALFHRPKEWQDQATPSGNSVAVHALCRLGKLLEDESWFSEAAAVLKSIGRPMADHPGAFSNMLCALDFTLADGPAFALAGDPQTEAARRMLSEISHRYLPNKAVACGLSEEPALLKGRKQIEGRATVYVCRQNTCSPPISEPDELASVLDRRPR